MTAPLRDGWKLWVRQGSAIVRHELRVRMLRLRSLPLLAMALLPLAIIVLARWTVAEWDGLRDPQESTAFFAGLYQVLILRTVVYFGSVWIFMNLFRQEILEKTLHYLLLKPLRREVVVAGKFTAGLLFAALLLGGGTLLAYVYMVSGIQWESLDPKTTTRLVQDGATYLGVTLLGCLGYGAVFTVLGLFLKNPVVPALGLYSWELLEFLLPPTLKKLSVIHYLKGLCPLPTTGGPFTVLAEPTPWWISLPGFFLLTAIVIGTAAVAVRRFEVDYSQD